MDPKQEIPNCNLKRKRIYGPKILPSEERNQNFDKCSKCNELHIHHIAHCHICKEILCPKECRTCIRCYRHYCEKHFDEQRCHRNGCLQRICFTNAINCKICNTPMCALHSSKCISCTQEVCTDCSENYSKTIASEKKCGMKSGFECDTRICNICINSNESSTNCKQCDIAGGSIWRPIRSSSPCFIQLANSTRIVYAKKCCMCDIKLSTACCTRVCFSCKMVICKKCGIQCEKCLLWQCKSHVPH